MSPDPMHLMTIEMGAWCGASGPGTEAEWAASEEPQEVPGA